MWMLYEILLVIGLLLYLPKAVWRRRLPHRGWSMRLGRYPARVVRSLEGRRALWIHAVSVGEVLAARPLLKALIEIAPADAVVVSTITPGGFAMASQHLGARGIALYFPLDLRACVTRALEAIRPRLLLLMESELWPTVIRLTKARGIPVAVVNGRISPGAFRRYQVVRSRLGGMLRRVDLFLMQSRADAERLIQLGASPGAVQVVGSLKWDASLGTRPAPEAIQDAAARLGLDGRQPVIVAGSTHHGEEPAVLRAFRALRASHPDARLLIAPRHLERLAEVEGLIRRAGLRPARLSRLPAAEEWQVGMVDTWGELPLYYGLASVVVIGGSFIPHGGQNPLEATSLGKPVVFGPSMHNFAEIVQQLLAHHAAHQLSQTSELPDTLHVLLADRAQSQEMGRRAQELTERSRGATQRTLDALRPLLAGT